MIALTMPAWANIFEPVYNLIVQIVHYVGIR